LCQTESFNLLGDVLLFLIKHIDIPMNSAIEVDAVDSASRLPVQ
jgi:hypothetical protein